MDSNALNHRIRIDKQLDPDHDQADLEELRRGLSATPRWLPSKHFYDARGSALFEQITHLPEYYPTRTERALLAASADEISRLTAAEELVELGAGAATKTRLLLDAMQQTGRLKLFVPFDVSESEVRRVAHELTAEYEELTVHGIVADFVHHLSTIPPGSPRLVILLGGTIGNYSPSQAIGLLQRLAERMAPGDFFLLGTDLIKDKAIIERAYNDSEGITAEFNRNILRVVNRLVGGTFDPLAYDHLAFYNDHLERIEMHLVATRDHAVELPRLATSLDIPAGERIRTEISCKYDRPRVDSMLKASGFSLERWFTDRHRCFGLALARRL